MSTALSRPSPRGAIVSVLEMRVFPDPILRQRARKVTEFDARLKQLASDMIETMDAYHGVGLAANQVGVLQRMCVIKMHDWEEAMVLVNPEIMRREGEREVEEGCLSLPGYRGMVNRAVRIRVRYQDLTGNLVRLKADCMLAQAIEHETDHLNGILYIDHLIAHDQFFRIKVNDEGEVEYLPTGEPDAAELEAAAWRMNNRPNIPQFDPTNGRPATGAPQADTAGAGNSSRLAFRFGAVAVVDQADIYLDGDRPDGNGPVDAVNLLTILSTYLSGSVAADVWLVGGAVRDVIAGRQIRDIDLAVAGDPAPIARAVADLVGGAPVHLEPWNIVRVALPVTHDGEKPFFIDIAGFNGAFEDNLRSRDYTVDAMALPIGSWDAGQPMHGIIDPLNGRADLARRTLRATGDGIFEDDPARMLRGVRLASQLAFRIEPETAGLIRRNAPLIQRVSGERVRDEFMAILETKGSAHPAGDSGPPGLALPGDSRTGSRPQLRTTPRSPLLGRVGTLAALRGVCRGDYRRQPQQRHLHPGSLDRRRGRPLQ